MAKRSGLPADAGLVNQDITPQIDRIHQAPQSPTDRHGKSYDNDVPSNWLRGMGEKSAEGKPGFDSTRARLAGGKHRDTP